MLFNHWYLVNREFLTPFDADELKDAWEVLEDEGVDSFAIGRSFTGIIRALTGAGVEIVEEDEFNAKMESGIFKKVQT